MWGLEQAYVGGWQKMWGPEQAYVGGWQKEAREKGKGVIMQLPRSIFAQVFFLYLLHEADTPSVLSYWNLPPNPNTHTHTYTVL